MNLHSLRFSSEWRIYAAVGLAASLLLLLLLLAAAAASTLNPS